MKVSINIISPRIKTAGDQIGRTNNLTLLIGVRLDSQKKSDKEEKEKEQTVLVANKKIDNIRHCSTNSISLKYFYKNQYF